MFRTSTDETKKQKPTTRGGPRGFPIQFLCLTSENRHIQHGTASFRRPLRDEKRGRYSFIYFWHYSEQWIGDGTKS